jgi:serine/threonine protein kinase
MPRLTVSVLMTEKHNSSGIRKAAVLTDFGLGKLTSTVVRGLIVNTNASTRCGTPEYMAPETLNGIVGSASDIFSLGCVIWEICERRPAYRNYRKVSVPSMRSNYRSELRDLIYDCMSLDSLHRPIIATIIYRLDSMRESECSHGNAPTPASSGGRVRSAVQRRPRESRRNNSYSGSHGQETCEIM